MTQPLSLLTVLSLLAGMILTSPVMAAGEAAPPPEEMEAAEKDPAIARQEEKIESIYTEMNALSDPLPDEDRNHFSLIVTNYNLIQTVKMVEKDVARAVKECGKNNPDMKKAMDERFDGWKGAVDPIIKDADANVDNMIAAQDYAKPKQIKKILKGLDESREHTNKQIEKIPVTTPEACDYLRNKMDETQESMVGLLQATLTPYSQIFPEDGNNKEEAKEEPEEEEKTSEPEAAADEKKQSEE